jgi:hypothetical protein
MPHKDELTQVLLDRATGPPPNPDPKLPPAWKRWLTAQRMQQAYANNWQPNPILLRLMEGR